MPNKYYAFISYSRKDEKYAKCIQNKQESYKLPSKIANNLFSPLRHLEILGVQ